MKKKIILITILVIGMLVLTLSIALANGEIIQRKVFGGGVADASGGNVQVSATLGQPVVGASSGGNISLGAGYWHGLGYDETKCGLAAGNTYHYNQTYPVTVEVVNKGTIDCIRVLRSDGNHIRATASLQTGRSWAITATDSGGKPAIGFSLTLTLPASFTPDTHDSLCRYTGSGQVWDCDGSSYDTDNNTITRIKVNQLSDWVAGNDADPTAIRLTAFQISAGKTAWGGGYYSGRNDAFGNWNTHFQALQTPVIYRVAHSSHLLSTRSGIA